MAIKAEISIKIYRSGIRDYAVRRTIFVNSMAEVLGRLREEADREDPAFAEASPHAEIDRRAAGSIIFTYAFGGTYWRLEADILSHPNRPTNE